MMKVQPRALVYRGVVVASGLFFPTDLLTEAQVRERILRLWTPGAIVYRLNDGLLLRLPTPLEIACEAAPGLQRPAVTPVPERRPGRSLRVLQVSRPATAEGQRRGGGSQRRRRSCAQVWPAPAQGCWNPAACKICCPAGDTT